MVQKWYTYLEINITAKDNNAPAKAVFQENCLKWGRKLGAPDTRSAKHAKFKEKYTTKNNSDIKEDTKSNEPMNKHAWAMSQDRTKAGRGSSAPGRKNKKMQKWCVSSGNSGRSLTSRSTVT